MGEIPCPEGILREGIFPFDKTSPNTIYTLMRVTEGLNDKKNSCRRRKKG